MARPVTGLVCSGLIAFAALALGRGAAAQDPPRAEVPIRAITLSNGALRYGVTLRIGARTLDAALDTGSTGLRVLPGVLAPGDAASSGEPEVYGYASGSRYEGVAGEAQVTLGALTARAPVQLIERIGCFAQQPRCPASRTPLPHYGIASDGLPDEGYKAILGTDMASARVGNPLMAMGVRRWIVELPRPGEPGPGRLILNPDAADMAGFVMLPLAAPYAQIQGGGLHDALPGCLVHSISQVRVCGPVLMDTGTPFMAVANDRRGPWPEGDAAALEFFSPGGAIAMRELLTVGDRGQAARLNWRDEPRAPGVVIFAGVSPYFAYSVLYDARSQRIGLKPRPAVAGAPLGVVIAAEP